MVLTSSRKKYINTDAGGDKLLTLGAEKKQLMEIDCHKSWAVKGQAESGMLRQLIFFEKTHIVAKWPDSACLEGSMGGLFERLKVVRDLNKKHLQRRAFIDLLKFMKDQGLRPNFQEKLQPFIIASKLVETDNKTL